MNLYTLLKLQSNIYYLLIVLIFSISPTNSMSCPAHTNKAGFYEFKECTPQRTPIKDKSGIHPITAEEKSARKAADYFIRLEMSNLMSQSDYEGEVHFAPMVKKYTNITLKDWNKQKFKTLEVLVCDRALLTEWKAIGSKRYEFSYQLQGAIDLKYVDKPDDEREKFNPHTTTLNASYQFEWVDGRWKISRAQFVPYERFSLLKNRMTRTKNGIEFTRKLQATAPEKHKKSVAENLRHAEKEYRLMQEVNRKVCAPFEGQ